MTAVPRDGYYSGQTHRAAVSRTSRRVRLLCLRMIVSESTSRFPGPCS